MKELPMQSTSWADRSRMASVASSRLGLLLLKLYCLHPTPPVETDPAEELACLLSCNERRLTRRETHLARRTPPPPPPPPPELSAISEVWLILPPCGHVESRQQLEPLASIGDVDAPAAAAAAEGAPSDPISLESALAIKPLGGDLQISKPI